MREEIDCCDIMSHITLNVDRHGSISLHRCDQSVTQT